MTDSVIPWDTSLHGGGTDGHIDQKKNENPIAALDENFYFDDSIDPVTRQRKHDYYRLDAYGWRRFNGSCTGLIATYENRFDAVATYAKMKANGRIDNVKDEYYGMTEQEVVDQWREGGEEASGHGSRMHAEIEKFYNNCADWTEDAVWLEDDDTTPALVRFLKFHMEVVVPQGIVPYRLELNIWDDATEFAGQADFVYQRLEWRADPMKRNWVGIGDWKRTKKDIFSYFSFGGKKMLGVCGSLSDCKRNHYALQMTLYAVVLQRRTNLVVKELHLGVFHEKHASYIWEPIKPLTQIAEAMLAERRKQLLAAYSQKIAALLQEPSELSAATRTLLDLVSRQQPTAEHAQKVGVLLQEPVASSELGIAIRSLLGLLL